MIFIDFAAGVWKNNTVEILANDQGNRTTPSYVAFTESERLIGESAKNQAAMNPKNTIFDGTPPSVLRVLFCREKYPPSTLTVVSASLLLFRALVARLDWR